jgi:hypothetical protein
MVGRRRAALALAVTLLAGGLLGAAPAAVASAAEVGAADAAATLGGAALAARIDERYRVLPTRDGLLLEPREEVPGVRSIEIAGGEVAVNGEPVAPTILRSWFGGEAEPLLALAALPSEEARALLAVPEGAPAAAGEPSALEEEELAAEAAAAREEEAALAEGVEEPADEDFDDLVYLGERFSLGGSVTIEEEEVASEVVVIGGAVHIRGRVDGDVVAVGGPVTIDGEVEGDVVSVGGGIRLGPEAMVGRDAVSVGGGVQKSRGARVGGQVTEAAFPWVWSRDLDWGPGTWGDGPSVRTWAISDAISNVMLAALLALLACLVVLIARGPVERAAARLETELWPAIAAGLATVLFLIFGLPVLALLLVLTVVGCLALPLIPVVLLLVMVLALVGYTAAAVQFGRLLADRFGWRQAGVYMPLLLGVLGIELWRLVGDMLQIAGGPVSVIAVVFLVLGALIELTAWIAGLGAVIMNLFAARRHPATIPAPPPALPPTSPPPAPLGPPAAAEELEASPPAPAEGPPAEAVRPADEEDEEDEEEPRRE